MYNFNLVLFTKQLLFAFIYKNPFNFKNKIWTHIAFIISISGLIIELLILLSYKITITINLTSFLGLIFLLIGQFLNYSVYKELGYYGVYYGGQYGYTIKWSNNFPYNTSIKNPQYIGAYMSYIGVFFILYQHISLNVLLRTIILMSCSYYFISYIESK